MFNFYRSFYTFYRMQQDNIPFWLCFPVRLWPKPFSKFRPTFFLVFVAIVFLWQFLAYLSLLRLR